MYDAARIRELGVRQVLADLMGVQWKREGDWFLALCPFHADKSPSFKTGNLEPHRGVCFSCGARGDVVELVATHFQEPIRAAMARISAHYHLDELPKGAAPAPAPQRPAAERTSEVDPTLYDLLEDAWAFAGELAQGSVAGRYLDDRGLWHAGLSSQPVRGVDDVGEFWNGLRRGGDRHRLRAAGLSGLYQLAKDPGGAVLFGCEREGRCVGWHVRTTVTERRPRWLFIGPGTPEPCVIRPTLGKLDHQVVLCEGATDALAWSRAGLEAWGIPGTGGFTRGMAERILASGRRPILALDDDNAGRKAEGEWGRLLEAVGVQASVARIADLGRAGVSDAGDAAREGLFVELLDLALGAAPWSAGVPEPSPAPPADAPTSAPDPRPAPQAEREETAPPTIAPGELTLDLIRERMPTLGLRWILVLVRQWWREGHTGAVDAALLGEMTVEWFTARGARWLTDSAQAPYIYWDRHLRHVGAKDRGWIGTLFKLGGVNRETREGKVILAACESHAWAQTDAPRVEPWATWVADESAIAVHTHDDEDRIVWVRAGKVSVEPNGAGRVLCRTDASTRALAYEPEVSAQQTASLLGRHFVSDLACSESERALLTTWVLTCWLRQRLNTRAIMFAQGPAGSGKTQAAKAATVLVYGAERLIDPTPAACRTEGALQPVVVLDNKESRNMDAGLVQFLLLSATGVTRKKRAEGSTDGIHDEQINAQVMVTAIEPPSLPELAARTLTLHFRHEWQRTDYQPAQALRALAKARPTILSGVWRIISERLLSGAAKEDLRRLHALVPGAHPRARLAEHMVLCAWLAGELRKGDPDIWGESRPNGDDLLKEWLEDEGHAAREQALVTDPIVSALGALLWAWNRIVLKSGERMRPAWDERWFRCRPLYHGAAGPTLHEDRGNRYCDRSCQYKLVVGVQGSYADLHADLLRASKEASAGLIYHDAVRNAGVLAARWHRNVALEAGEWAVERVEVTATGRVYRFTCGAEPAEWYAARGSHETGADPRADEPTLPF